MLPDYILPHHTPPPGPPLTLTVDAKGCAYLSKRLLYHLRLRAGQAADLLPPSADCASWQLDLRPDAARCISWHIASSPRIRGVQLPAGLLQPGTKLTLALASDTTASPGLYQLTPAAKS